MRPDRFEKTVVIPLRVVKRQLHYLYGGPLPNLPDGTRCDLIVPLYAIEDKAFLAQLEASHVEDLLPQDANILAAVSSAQMPGHLTNRALSLKEVCQHAGRRSTERVSWDLTTQYPDSVFVQVVLKEPLRLELRGTKHGRLLPVRCAIPALEGKEAISLNHAYRLISEEFEPKRISHAGNVFHKMVYLDHQGCFSSLDQLRAKFESQNYGTADDLAHGNDSTRRGASERSV